MSMNSWKGWLCVAAALALLSTGALADELLMVDLSVENQVTISATDGVSAVTTSGSGTTGVYFENFYGVAGEALDETLVLGDLTNAENLSDGSPDLFRGGSGDDPGLNLWSFATDYTVTFTADSLAFVGSGTWTLDPLAYEDMKNGASGGNLYFPADTYDDIENADLLGTYSVYVPEPATLSLVGLAFGLCVVRRRK